MAVISAHGSRDVDYDKYSSSFHEKSPVVKL
jgi:hypothetical protein